MVGIMLPMPAFAAESNTPFGTSTAEDKAPISVESDSGEAYTSTAELGNETLPIEVTTPDTTFAGSKEITFTIAKADITIKANDKSAYVGDTAPELKASDYTMTGLASGETLKTEPTITYAAAPDMTKEGTVDIKAS